MSKINFPNPTPIPAKFGGVLFGVDPLCCLSSAESEMVRLLSCEIIFQEFQPI